MLISYAIGFSLTVILLVIATSITGRTEAQYINDFKAYFVSLAIAIILIANSLIAGGKP